jgi:hypothetical protein
MERMHFVEGDTDSAYWAVAGNPQDSRSSYPKGDAYKQAFKHVIKDREFYDAHVYDWFPNPCKDIHDECAMLSALRDEKKLLGLMIEKQDENCIALAPKCYCLFPNQNVSKMKGVKKSLNPLGCEDYDKAFESTVKGENINLQLNQGTMSKITIHKNALTGTHTKAVVLENESCAPFVYGIDACHYFVT